MAMDPTTGIIYVIVKFSGVTGRVLATLDMSDPAAPTVTEIGNTLDNVAGIAFDEVGLLYAITGDGASVSETLFDLDKTTGALTELVTLGPGSDGESIAFNDADGLIYHYSGRDTNNALQTIDPDDLTVVDLVITGFDSDEMFGMTYDPSVGGVFGANLDMESVVILPSGEILLEGDQPSASDPIMSAGAYCKGMLFAPTNPVVPPSPS